MNKSTCEEVVSVKDHAPSMLPAGKKWKLVWNDEFDGTELDKSKWGCRLYMMQKRHEHLIGEEGVSLNGKGSLLFHLVKKEDGEFYTTQLQTGENFMDRPPEDAYGKFRWPIATLSEPKYQKKYGYFECRCKLQREKGWWSAFWIQAPTIGASMDTAQTGVEVDVMECFSRGNEVSHNLWWGGYGKTIQEAPAYRMDLENREGWHIFAVEWTPKEYIFYVDGKETWRFDKVVSHTEQFILLTTECQAYRFTGEATEDLKNAKLPDCFEVDYVRVYDEVDEQGSPVYR